MMEETSTIRRKHLTENTPRVMEERSTIKRKPLPDKAVAKHIAHHIIQYDSIIKDDTNSQSSFKRVDEVGKSWLSILLLAAILVGCTLGLLLAMGYLIFLWFANPATTIWKVIILSDWTATSLAICGVAIRWLSSFQMMLCTSILAWNVLKEGTPASKIPRLSSLRYNNAGPLDLMNLLPIWSKSSCHLYLFVIILLSALTTILLQLSSTLLLSDLAILPVRSFRNNTNRAVLYSGGASIFENDPWLTTVPTYPLFAESLQYDQREHSEAVDDTGPAIRALLPVPADKGRAKLLSFDGNATLYDARCICTRPLLTNLSLTGNIHISEFLFDGRLKFAGEVNHSVFIPPMASGGFSQRFNCSIPVYAFMSTDQPWTVATCSVEKYFGLGMGIINSLERVYNSSIVYTYPKINEFSETNESNGLPQLPFNTSDNAAYFLPSIGESWLVINVTSMPRPRSKDIDLPLQGRISINESWTSTSRGLWARVTSTQEDAFLDDNDNTLLVDWPFTLDVTVCSNAFSWLKNMYINAEKYRAVEEPVSHTAGIKQIGADGLFLTPEERGIMTLNVTELHHQLSEEQKDTASTNGTNHLLPTSHFVTSPESRSWTSFDPGQANFDHFGWVNEERLALFKQVIQQTNSPALAIQSMMHTMIADRYYKYLPYFRNTTQIRWTHSIDATQPVRTRGFITVMAGISIHLLLVAYILIVFGLLKGTKRAIRSIDEAWQVIAQVALLQNEITIDIGKCDDKAGSTSATDHEVEKSLKRRGLKDKIFVLDDRNESGVVRFRAKEESGP
jgi:hypothetical protein